MVDVKPGIPSFYSPAQVQLYLQRIGFQHDGDLSSFIPNLDNLTALMKLHTARFPYENILFHYSASHTVDVSLSFVYKRLVEDSKGGTWCLGHNALFLNILRGLGYRGYGCVARANRTQDQRQLECLSFFVHMMLVVQLDPQMYEDDGNPCSSGAPRSYLVDVGFNPVCMVCPIRLEHGYTVPGTAPPEEFRLVRVMNPESSLRESDHTLMWSLQHRCGLYRPEWFHLYLFQEVEYFPGDWAAFNHLYCEYPSERQRDNVICIRHFFLEDEQKEGKGGKVPLMGRMVLWGTRVQRRIGDRIVMIKEFSSEGERIRSLKDDFGVTVDQDDIQLIASTRAAIRSQEKSRL